MQRLNKPVRKSLPRAIPSDELVKELGDSKEFCSLDASGAMLREERDRWPYLFSHPLSAGERVPVLKGSRKSKKAAK